MSDEIKPCPFCAGDDVEHSQYGSFGIDWHHVYCRFCGTRGPNNCDADAADANWNALPREPTPLVWSSERPKAVGKWCVRFKSLSDRELRDWWVIEVDSAQLRQHDWCEKNGIDPHAEFEFAGPFPEPKEEEK